MSFDFFTAVESLRSNWSNLTPLERSVQLKPILAAGMSRRTLAKSIPCSEALIRFVEQIGNLPAVVQQRVAAGQITATAAVREAATQRRLSRERQVRRDEALAVNTARIGADAILAWFYNEHYASWYAETVTREALSMVRATERSGGTKNAPKFPDGTSIEQIIAAVRVSPRADADEMETITCLAMWMARWTICTTPDASVREQAYHIALEELTSPSSTSSVPPRSRNARAMAA